jgi:pimeloyl-ACP methyl ester carboxylesterase
VEALSREWRVFAVDVIGQPGKSLARRRIRDRRDYGRWLAGVLDHLGVAKASFVGCSFGGFLAASQALLTPDRVDRLVLIGPVGVFASMSWTLAVLMRTARLRRRIRGLFGDRRPPDPATLHAAAVPLHPKDAAWRALMGVTMAEAPTVSITRAKVFSRAELRRITAPMLLLIGEHERLYDARATLKLALVLKPGLQAEIVEAADHLAAMAQPERVNPQIAGFLRGSAALS